jgi:NTE family protein
LSSKLKGLPSGQKEGKSECPDVVGSEGSIVILDGDRFYNRRNFSKGAKIVSYEWKLLTDKDDVPISYLADHNPRYLAFMAPYLDDGTSVSKTIDAQLTVRDDSDKSSTSKVEIKIKRVQRVLVLQGGGALGAYQAGVFKALYEKIKREDQSKGRQGRPLFDIVAGTSIGAINAAVIISYALSRWRKQTENGDRRLGDAAAIWQDSDKWIYRLWDDISSYSAIDIWLLNPLFRMYWDLFWINTSTFRDIWNNISSWIVQNNEWLRRYRETEPGNFFYFLWPDNHGPVGSPDAARKYYSNYLSTVFGGTPWVLSYGIPQYDMKFFDPSKTWSRFDNTRFTTTLQQKPDSGEFNGKYWDDMQYPIKTAFEKGQPRLIFVSVDVKDSKSVWFDSYSDNSEYGLEGFVRKINYREGLNIKHLKTSITSFPSYIYPSLKTDDGKDIRTFWDGVFLSNTPLREVIQAHRNYWHKKKNEDVPDLEVYIVGLYPTLDDEVPIDRDAVENREYDILFNDKTEYDEKVARITSDYIELAERLKELAAEKGATEEEINSILNQLTNSRSRQGERRIFKKLLEGRFKLTRVVRIENSGSITTQLNNGQEQTQNRDNEIFGKAFDFTKSTVQRLRETGYADANGRMDIEFMIDNIWSLMASVEAKITMTRTLDGNVSNRYDTEKMQDLLGELQDIDKELQSLLIFRQQGKRQGARGKINTIKQKLNSIISQKIFPHEESPQPSTPGSSGIDPLKLIGILNESVNKFENKL